MKKKVLAINSTVLAFGDKIEEDGDYFIVENQGLIN